MHFAKHFAILAAFLYQTLSVDLIFQPQVIDSTPADGFRRI
jgi:hypothetical protein